MRSLYQRLRYTAIVGHRFAVNHAASRAGLGETLTSAGALDPLGDAMTLMGLPA